MHARGGVRRQLLRVVRRAVPAVVAALAVGQAAAQSARELADLSIEELSNIEVTSVSRRPESLAQSAASIYVITAEDIRRAGATTLPEALRLAPNLEVGRYSASGYTISARGFNSINAANKMLVLIDGRSVFTPFFNSAYWDQQDVMLADVDRIEVISGPGGTLWGANAVNGVINVITRPSGATQGGLVDALGGDFEQRAALRYGGRLGDHANIRAYAQAFGTGDTFFPDGSNPRDGWHGTQAGFRSDVDSGAGSFTVQGDAYENRVDTPSARRNGGNVLGRWSQRINPRSTLDVQAFYDEQNRSDSAGPGATGMSAEQVRTLDIEAEQTWASGRHAAVWGLGHRAWRDSFVNTANGFVLDPASQAVSLTNVYAQDTYAVTDALKLTAGIKFEYSSLSGWAVMPNVRAGWQAAPRQFVWAAVSRAVRPPSRLERDLTFPGLFDTSPDFESEKLVAYEAGWRSQLAPRASASVSLFYNDYTDLRTTALGTGFFPGQFRNGLEGHTYGLEAWGSFAPVAWWRLDPGVTLLHKDFHLKPGEIDASGPQTVVGHDPASQWFLRSYMDLPRNVRFYVGLRRVAALGDIGVPGYFAADVDLAWKLRPDLELSVKGENLTDARHAEASQPPIHEIPRTAWVGVRWTFP